MTAPRSTVLLLVACLALLVAGHAFAEPVETPPGAPPGVPEETAPTGELPPLEQSAGLDLSNAAPGRLPNTDGPALPNVIGRTAREAAMALGQWRLREESVVTAQPYCGRVVDQHPDVASTLAPGEVVTIVVGVPRMPSNQYRAVPRVESLKAVDAVNLLRKQGFDVMLRVAESFDSVAGTVVAQAPRPMSIDRIGQKVTVVVGKGGIADPVEPVEEPGVAPLPPPAAPTPAVPLPAVDETAPPAGPAVVPEGPPPGMTETPPPTPPREEPRVMPPSEPPPTEPVVEEPPPVMPPTEPPPTEPVVEEPPPAVVPVPVQPAPPPAPPVRLAVPALVSPASGQSYPRAFGSTFTWKPIAGATRYEWQLQVAGGDDEWSDVSTQVVEEARYRPKRMEEGHYRWRVRAMTEDVEGEWSPYFELFMYGP